MAMFSMLKYFKRKFKPGCMGTRSPSGSFRRNKNLDKNSNLNDKIKQKIELKLNASKCKRNFIFRVKLGQIGHKLSANKKVSASEAKLDVNGEFSSNSQILSESDDSKRFNLASYTNCTYSCSKIDENKYMNELKMKENFACSSVDGDFLNSTSLGHTNSSGYVEYATGSSNYCSNNTTNQRTTNESVNSDTSMLTYNTKYANSQVSDDDGLMSVDSSESMHNQSSLSMTDTMQQSTPYNENFARIRSLKVTQKRSIKSISKCNTANPLVWKPNMLTKKIESNQKIDSNDMNDLNESFKQHQQNSKDGKANNKCRRSNTTYTLMGKSSNKVIDYFNKLELSKPVKKIANIRKLDKMVTGVEPINNSEAILVQVNNDHIKFKQDDAKMSETIESLNKIANGDLSENEIEKIQDVLFHDESLMTNTNRANSNISINSTSSSDQSSSDIELPPSSLNSASKLHLLDTKNQSSPRQTRVDQQEVDLKLNETHSINCSMEKLRRTISMPGIENNSNIMANVSKISIIKDSNLQCEETLNSNIENNSIKSFIRDSMQKIEDNTSSPIPNGDQKYDVKTENSVSGEFIRGDPKARLSQKNIKQMFKNVVKYQMSALDSLEKFYENHVEKLEVDRDVALSAHQDSKDKINQFFDSQLKLLEERVQANLKFICENKSNNKFSTTTNGITSTISSQNNSSTELNVKNSNILSQKLSQIYLLKQMQAQKTNEEIMNQLTRSRNLIGLKASLMNQNNILPSFVNKTQLIRQSTNKNELNSMFFSGNSFKRNILSRNTIVNIENRETSLKSSPRKLQTHSTSRIDYTTQEQTGFVNFSPFELTNFKQLNQSKTNLNLKSQFQYQKNVGFRKNYSSNESISKMGRSASIETFNDSNPVKSSNSNLDEKLRLETVNLSTYSKIKRQNKSANSLKVEEHNTPDGFSSLTQEENRNHFRLNYSRNSSIYNSSMRNTSILNGTFGESNHLIKYLPPRFSDAHIHLKLNQQKLAANRNELKYLNQRYLTQLQHMPKALTDSDRISIKSVKPLETSV